jgi:hypothetical protein
MSNYVGVLTSQERNWCVTRVTTGVNHTKSLEHWDAWLFLASKQFAKSHRCLWLCFYWMLPFFLVGTHTHTRTHTHLFGTDMVLTVECLCIAPLFIPFFWALPWTAGGQRSVLSWSGFPRTRRRSVPLTLPFSWWRSIRSTLAPALPAGWHGGCTVQVATPCAPVFNSHHC